jgi:hypothetical protein
MKDEDVDKIVDEWFDEFEKLASDLALLKDSKKVRPDFDIFKNKYVCNYVLHCPVFYELYVSGNSDCIDELWNFFLFKKKLCKSGLKTVNCTYSNCLTCKGRNGVKACEVFKHER